jgi:S1-C subfamily serine protease
VHVKGEDRIVALWTKETLGHACPINSTDALTADHVALKEMFLNGSEAKFAPFVVWGDELGNTGTAQWQWSDKRRDLSLIRTVVNTPPFTAYLRRAADLPAIGSKVYVVGYDFKTVAPGTGGLGDYTMEATVTGIRAGVLVYGSTPGGGSSGGCVLNARGEIVAVNVAMIAGEGLGLLVVGPWAEVPDAFLEGKR